MKSTFYKKYTEQILFGILITFYIIIFYIYSLEKCYPRIGFAGVYGICIGTGFLFAGLFLKEDFKRLEKRNILKPFKKEKSSKRRKKTSLIVNHIITFFIGYQVAYVLNGNYNDLVENPASVIFSLHLSDFNLLYPIYGMLLVFISILLSNNQEEKKENNDNKKVFFPSEIIFNFAVAAFVGGIVGAKLLYVFTESGNFFDKLFSTSGLTFYGGLIGGAISVIIYSKKLKLPILSIADCFAPILMLGYSIGRMGCQLAGDGCWGIKNNHNHSILPDWLWSNEYIGAIHGQPIEYNYFLNEQPNISVFPTPIYETSLCFIFFLFLWFIRKKINIPGLLFSIYFMLNGIERFFIEKIRVNPPISYKDVPNSNYLDQGIGFYNNGDIILNSNTQAQFIAISLFIIGLLGFIYLLKRNYDTKKSIKKI
ncbi:MAG: hypothetical protein CMP74_01430 [Flavobacteriales bacterium]|nr:hypothetical protein [Flavobacteriales bacterium]